MPAQRIAQILADAMSELTEKQWQRPTLR